MENRSDAHGERAGGRDVAKRCSWRGPRRHWGSGTELHSRHESQAHGRPGIVYCTEGRVSRMPVSNGSVLQVLKHGCECQQFGTKNAVTTFVATCCICYACTQSCIVVLTTLAVGASRPAMHPRTIIPMVWGRKAVSHMASRYGCGTELLRSDLGIGAGNRKGSMWSIPA